MKRKTREEMRPIVEAYAQYKGDKNSFCRKHEISLYQLSYWRGQLKRVEGGTSSFIALESEGGFSKQAVELYYPNGLRALVPLDAPGRVWDRLLNFVG